MGVLDRQTLRGEVKNRKLGRERLAMRDRRRLARNRTEEVRTARPGADRRSLTRPGAAERRRPDRGLRDAGLRRRRAARSTPALVRFFDRLSDLAHGFGRLLAFVLLVPLLLLRLLLSPSELVERVREAPGRLRATTKRLRHESKDPGTAAGRAVETGRLALWFLEEELADMRDGIPTADDVRRDLRSGGVTLLDHAARFVGLKEGPDGTPVGERLGYALSAGLVLGVVGIGLFLAVFNGIEELKTSDQLALQEIEVLGAARVDEGEILARLGAAPGDNLLEMDVAGLGLRVPELDWVDSVEVERDLTGRRLEVRVVEHRPVLLVPGQTLGLMNDRGEVFKEWQAGEPFDLPLLTSDEPLTEDAHHGALDVLRALGAGGVIGGDGVSELAWDPARGFTLITHSGLPVHVGKSDFAARLDRVDRAVRDGRLPLDAVASVDAGLRDRLIAVPRKARKARRKVRKVVESQPTPKRDRARLLHLERIAPSEESLFFGADATESL